MGWFKKSISRATGNFVKELGNALGDSSGRLLEAVPGGHVVRREYKRALDKAGKEIKSWDLPSLKQDVPDVSVEMPDYSEYLAAMGEYISAMNEAMNRQEPAQEPLKAAQVEMSAARADTNRKQLMRRGLMSTYTRYGQSGGTQRLGA